MGKIKFYLFLLLTFYIHFNSFGQLQKLNPKTESYLRLEPIQLIDQDIAWWKGMLRSLDGCITWETHGTNGTTNDFLAKSKDTVFVLKSTFLIKSVNGGVNWDTLLNTGKVSLDPNVRNPELKTLSVNTGFIQVLGTVWDNRCHTIVYTSTDDGKNWTSDIFWEELNENFPISSKFLTKDLGWVILLVSPTDYNLIKTTNGGFTWQYQFRVKDTKILHMEIFNKDLIFLFCLNKDSNKCAIYKSVDGGNTWKNVQNNIGIIYDGWNDEYKFIMKEGTNEIYASLESYLYYSQDLGDNWTLKEPFKDKDGSQFSEFCMSNVVNNIGYAVAYNNNGETVVLKTTDCWNTWKILEETRPVTLTTLNDIFFLDNNIGWTCGNDGLIMKTTDGGISWEKQTSNTSNVLNSIKFVSYLNGWAVGNDGTIIHSNDGGETWSSQQSNIGTYTIYDVYFDKNNHGWATAGTADEKNGILIQTTNGGENWYQSVNSTGFPLKHIFFDNNNVGFAYGDQSSLYIGGVYQTTDNGQSWDQTSTDVIKSIYITDNNEGWRIRSMGYSGMPQYIEFASDGFDNWTMKKEFTNNYNWRGIQILESVNYNIFALLYRGSKQDITIQMWHSPDNGSTWTEFAGFGYMNFPKKMCVNPQKDLYLVGTNGYIWKLDHKNLLTNIENIQTNTISNSFSLSQNYPNPFNPTTTINYQIPSAGHVSLKVYDVLGREIATLVNEEKSAGNYEVKFDGSNLSSGVYFYRLQAGSFSETKKFILIK